MAEPRPTTFQHRLEFAAFRAVQGVLAVLPEPLALSLGEGLGWFAGRVLRLRRAVVMRNLQRAFPELDPSARTRIAVGAWRHLGREAVMLFRGSHLRRRTPEALLGRVEFVGLEALRTALGEGRGAVLVTGHLGSWEMGGALLAAAGIALDVVALVQGNPLFDAELRQSREALGMQIIDRGNAHRDVLRSLRKGRAAALVADQNARRGGVEVQFFGHSAPTFKGPAVFALRTGAPLFMIACLRTSRVPQRYRLHAERIEHEPTGDFERDVERLTQAHTARLEHWVRQAPDQYFWPHDRWKQRGPVAR